MVADAFKVADRVEQFGDLVAVPLRQLLAAEFHKIGAEFVLVQIEPVLVGPDLLVQLGRIGADTVYGGKNRSAGQIGRASCRERV